MDAEPRVYEMKMISYTLFLHIYVCIGGMYLAYIFGAIFSLYCFSFLDVHSMYVLRKLHCTIKTIFEIYRTKDFESTLYIMEGN